MSEDTDTRPPKPNTLDQIDRFENAHRIEQSAILHILVDLGVEAEYEMDFDAIDFIIRVASAVDPENPAAGKPYYKWMAPNAGQIVVRRLIAHSLKDRSVLPDQAELAVRLMMYLNDPANLPNNENDMRTVNKFMERFCAARHRVPILQQHCPDTSCVWVETCFNVGLFTIINELSHSYFELLWDNINGRLPKERKVVRPAFTAENQLEYLSASLMLAANSRSTFPEHAQKFLNMIMARVVKPKLVRFQDPEKAKLLT